MKRLIAAVLSVVFLGLSAAAALAGGQGSAQTQQTGQAPVEVQSSVPQSRIDTVVKRENAKADVAKKQKVRAKNMKSKSNNNSNLFQNSK